MKINYNRPSEQILYDLLYYTGGAWLPKDSLSFGAPQPWGPIAGDPYQRDTQLDVTVGPGAHPRQRGTATIRYRREDVGTMPVLVDVPIEVESLPFTTHQLLPQLNLRYGLQLGPADLLNETFWGSVDGYSLHVAPGSLVWRGTFFVETTYKDRPLSEILLVRELSGLWYEVAA